MTDTLQIGADPAAAKALCVFVHGRGQTPEAMVEAILRYLPREVTYALPRAAGQSWYAARAIDPLTHETAGELNAARAQVIDVVDALRRAAPGKPLLLAGFSQGACLSLEIAFGGATGIDALAALTGCRVGQAGDHRPAMMIARLPVYLSGADADPWIPVTAFAEAVADLGRGGACLRADLFPGRAHEVSLAEINMLCDMLNDLASGFAPRMEARR